LGKAKHKLLLAAKPMKFELSAFQRQSQAPWATHGSGTLFQLKKD
jgi:hypothetical protein